MSIQAKKKWGQHFLTDVSTIDIMMQALGDVKDVHVFEIGPGMGALTKPLWSLAPLTYTGLEVDDRCVEFLTREHKKSALPAHYRVQKQDALTFDFSERRGRKILISNLPYMISTEILCRVLPCLSTFEMVVLMFQKEVADRITATPRTKAYGRLSIVAQAVAAIDELCHVPPEAFSPPPSIDSTVLLFKPLEAPQVQDAEAWHQLSELVRKAFVHRRKKLRKCLTLSPEMDACYGHMRPEELTVSDYLVMTRAI